MSNRPSFSRTSSMIVNVGGPSPAPSPGPGKNPRTTSYHGSGPNYGTRDSEHTRQSLPPARRNSSRTPLPSRASNTTAASNRATAGSTRTTQPGSVPPSGRGGPRGTPIRLHQGLQQTVGRNSLGHRNEPYRAEPTNMPQYRYSNHRALFPATSTQRSQPRPPATVHNGGNARGAADPSGADYAHNTQGLVRVGGSRSVYPRY